MRMRRRRPAAVTVGLVVLSLTIIAALAAYAFLGWFSRYAADDYCTAGAERAFGFLGAQAYWYQNWSGRFTYFGVSGLIELAGPGIVQVLPSLALAAWTGVGAWALRPIAVDHGWPIPRVSAVALSGALILVCLQGTPDLDQALYWQTGMLTYLLPIILLTGYAGWLLRYIRPAPGRPAPGRRTSRWGIGASGAFVFVAGGVSETSLAVQLALLGMATLAAAGLLRSTRFRIVPVMLATGLLATALSAGVVVAAPGNSIREAQLTGSVHGLAQLPSALQASVDFVGLFARTVQFRARFAVVPLAFLGVSFGMSSVVARGAAVSVWRGWFVDLAGVGGAIGCGWVLLMAATVPGYFAQQFDPPQRAQFVGVWVAAISLVGASYFVGRLAARAALRWNLPAHVRWYQPAWAVCALMLAGSVGATARLPLAQAPDDAAYAMAWDAVDASLRNLASTHQPVVLERTLPAHFGFDFVGSDPGAYPNPCVAQFYTLPSITSESE